MPRDIGVPHHLLQEALAYKRNRSIAHHSLYGFLVNATLVLLLSMDLYFLYTFKMFHNFEILWYIEFGLISIFAFNALTTLYAYSTPSKFVTNKALSSTQMQLLGLNESNVQIDDSISLDIQLSPVKTSTPEGSPTSQKLDSMYHNKSRSFTYFPSQPINQEQLSTSFNQLNLSLTRSYNDEAITDMQSLENYLKSADNSAINTSLSQSMFEHSNLSLGRSMDHSLTFPSTYQIATNPQTNYSTDDSQKIEAKVWSQLGIKRNELEVWTNNCKLWISMTILHKIINEIDRYNKILIDLGSPEYQIGLISMSMLRQLAINRQDQLTNLPLLIPYLNLHPNHDYLVTRIRELAKGSDISLYRWNSGGSYKGKKWGNSFPTDAQIIIHLFCTYMDSMVPPTLTIADTQPFTNRFFASAPQRFEDIQGVIAIYQTQILPPNFSLLTKDKGLLTVPKGRLNLFHSIVAFLHYCYHKESGMLGQVNLSLLGLNLFTVIDISSPMETPSDVVITAVSAMSVQTAKSTKPNSQLRYKSTRALPSKPLFFLGEGNNSELIQKVMEEIGWQRSDNRDRFKLKWVQLKASVTFREFKEGIQMVNHFPNMDLIGNKRNLVESLREHSRIQFRVNPTKPITLNEFLPETFILDSPREKEQFLTTIRSEGSMWICKPTHRNQGQGIFLIRGPDEVEAKLASTSQTQTLSFKAIRRLVQRYIMNPLLLEGRKFDIRVYMLIIAAKPYLVFYHSGYVRLSCVPFVLDNEDMHTHLTNQCIQKQHPSYQDIKETTVWSFEKFQQYIDEFYTEAKDLPPRWVFTTMTKKIQSIMQICFSSIMRKLHHRVGYFELLGFDFMVDTDFRVWLIEVNVNPALHTNCDYLLTIIPNVVRDSINLSIEVFEKCIKHKPLLPILLNSSFIPIYKGR